MRYDYRNYDCNCETYQAGDSCYAEVTGRCGTGIFLQLDDGQSAFSNTMHNLAIGAKVLCTILKQATDVKRVYVSTDAVVAYA